MKRMSTAALASVVFIGAAAPAVAIPAGNTVSTQDEQELPALMLVLDSSGSMDEPSGAGGTRMDAAREALAEVVAATPDGTPVGLRTIGGERPDEGSCADTRLMIEPGPIDAAVMSDTVGNLEPQGDTPLAASLELAASDLPRDRRGIIVVVTDGEETCGGDPCEVAGQLVESGVDVRIDVVGFQVDSAAREQLECVAKAGEGTYVDAPDADALAAQLQRLAVRGLRVFTPSGIAVDGTATPQDAPEIQDGRYVDDLVGTEPNHYQVDLPQGSTLWVAASGTAHFGSLTDSLDVQAEVTSQSGATCVSELTQAVGATSRGLPITVALVADFDVLEQCGSGPYVVKLTQTRGSNRTTPDRAIELIVGFEADVADRTGLPPAADAESWRVEPSISDGEPEPVIGSPNIASATPVQPGRYSDTILIGETLYFGVEVEWGQQLVCQAEYMAEPLVGSGVGPSLPAARTHVYGPYRGELSGPDYTAGGTPYSGDESVVWTSTSPPVRYLNREDSYAQHAAVPGTYYCGVKLAGDAEYAGIGEIPIELTVDVLGTAGAGAPTYVQESTPDPEPSPQATGTEHAAADDDQTAEPTATEGDDLSSWPMIIGAIALGLLVASFSVVLLRRRSGSTGRAV